MKRGASRQQVERSENEPRGPIKSHFPPQNVLVIDWRWHFADCSQSEVDSDKETTPRNGSQQGQARRGEEEKWGLTRGWVWGGTSS